jgi:hypothetical protein
MRPSKPGGPRGNWEEPPEWRVRPSELWWHLVVVLGACALGGVACVLAAFVPPLNLIAWATIAAVVLAIALAPWTRSLLLAIGAARVAALLARLDAWSWGRDPVGGAAATLAQGLLRNPDDARIARRLDAILADPTLVVGAGVVLAAGIRALARREIPEARRLLRLVAEFDTSRRPPTARRWAIDLLAALAVAEGDLGLLERELTAPRVPRTHFGELLRLCSARAQGTRVTENQLRRAWFLAGAETATWKRVERLLAEPPPNPAPSVPFDTPLQGALVATARLFGEAPPPRAAIDEAAARWDQVMADGTELPGGGAGAARVRVEVVALLAERLSVCREPANAAPDGPILR